MLRIVRAAAGLGFAKGRIAVLATVGSLALAGVMTSASSAHTGPCATRVDRTHVIRVRGHVSVVHRISGHRVELVLLHASRFALRLDIAGPDSCRVDLVRFERRWRSAPYELHARLRTPAGSWEIRVTFEHYDTARDLLRVRGILEDHEVTARAARTAFASQQNDATEIVYASDFIPFDSSF